MKAKTINYMYSWLRIPYKNFSKILLDVFSVSTILTRTQYYFIFCIYE